MIAEIFLSAVVMPQIVTAKVIFKVNALNPALFHELCNSPAKTSYTNSIRDFRFFFDYRTT